MTTLLYAVVEPDRGVVRHVSAGHVPPVLAEPGRPARFLTGAAGPGPPLGAVDVPRYAETVEPFGAGTMLILYTDGLVERRAEVLDVGLERLRAAVDACAGGSPEDARAAVLAACLGDEPAGDDVTVVCLRAREQLGSPARFVLTADPGALTALRRALRRWLAEVGADAAEAAEITLAANEAWQNAIEHGHAFASTPIAVELALEDGVVVCTVRDRGHEGERRSDPDRGRGIPLMRRLMDDLELDVGGAHGGTVVLRRRLGRPLSAAAGMDG
jgi:anti-sigma regulatory factor (Ser/Thr protein kinase)